jgi:RNA polymerase sigma-70 factor (ECF subfamily)
MSEPQYGTAAKKMLERTDAELVEAARHGDVNSFGELYRRHYAAAVGIAYCATSDRHLAEDAAQEAFAVACRDLGRLRKAEKFAPWLRAICRKTARRLAKAKWRHRLPEKMPLEASADPGNDRVDMVRQAMQRLPTKAREMIVLHYYSGLTHDQIAATLGISPQAVHGRLLRARRKMAEDLRRNGLGRRTQ